MTTILTAETIRRLDPHKIKVPPHHRPANMDWVEALAADFTARGQEQPIKVVESDDGGFELVFGEQRRLAAIMAGKQVDAIVETKAQAASEAQRRMSAIAENIYRRPNTVLERARDISEWRAIHEAAHGKAKPGRKKASEDLEELGANFALNFSDAAQRALDMSRRSVFLALKIGSLPDKIADAIAVSPVADKQSDLLTLAGLDAKTQEAVAALISSGEVLSVDDALAKVENRPPEPKVEAWQRVSNGIAALSSTDRDRFFEFIKPTYERWLAERG